MEKQAKQLKKEGVSYDKSQGLGSNSFKKLESPNHAMEFLCRSWSPSASDFLNIFSSRNILIPGDMKRIADEKEQVMSNITGEYKTTIREDNVQNWLKGKSLASYLQSRKEKKKEETRLRTSQLHAALSLTQLAAAIAGIHKGKSGTIGQDMDQVVASAAALVTTTFAEAAESLGAERAQVQAAVTSGMAIQTPIDMIAVTATAATCLRGAAVLRSRTMENTSAQTQQMLRMDAQICIIMPSGHRECTRVSVYMKQKHLILSFGKKYLRGALTSTRAYKIISILEETMEGWERSVLSLKTNNGVIKLLFKDEMQSRIWISTIFNLFQIQDPCWQENHSNYHFPSSSDKCEVSKIHDQRPD